MITAIEFLRRDESGVYSEQDIVHAMIEFAKLHVQESLNKAKVAAEYNMPEVDDFGLNCIMNSYPLENIK